MSNSLKALGVINTRETPQTQPIPFENQVKNSAGGYVYEADDWAKLTRFLVLGVEGGSYYISQQKMTLDSANTVMKLIDRDGVKVVQTVVEVSDAGRAPKNDAALFVLAMAASTGNKTTKRAAFRALPLVARTATHLYHFAQFVDGFRGWGRELRNAVQNWYMKMPVEKLANQAIKYKSRDGWSHRDLLRLSHPKTEDAARDAVFRYMLGGLEKVNETARVRKVRVPVSAEHPDGFRTEVLSVPSRTEALPAVIDAAERLLHTTDVKTAVKLIQDYNLPREVVPTQLLNDKAIWEALLEKMPVTATIRNLAKMTNVGLLSPLSQASQKVRERITDPEILKKGRVHPIQLLAALMTYKQGRGEKGSLTWTPDQRVIDALDAGFYAAFGAVEPTGLNGMLAVDVSGSMGWPQNTIAGIPGLTPRIASAALALVTANVESNYMMVGFSHTLVDLRISPRMRLDDVVKYMESVPMGGTDCSLPVEHARKHKLPVDWFAVLTDNETYAGRIHVSQGIKKYRLESGRPGRFAVLGMVNNNFTIADPKDRGMMDFCGFDTATPTILSAFARGEI